MWRQGESEWEREGDRKRGWESGEGETLTSAVAWQAQRKLEQEMEMRRKAEGSLQDTKDQLQTEISTRVMMSSSTQHANEKNMQLDKHVGGTTTLSVFMRRRIHGWCASTVNLIRGCPVLVVVILPLSTFFVFILFLFNSVHPK